MKKLKNKKIGAKVLISELLVDINPKDGWKKIKNVIGVIVDRGNHVQYYYTCDGAKGNVRKHTFESKFDNPTAVKLDGGIKDIAGNNIVVFYESDIKYLEYMPKSYKVVSKKEYNKAQKLIEKYEYQRTLK